VTEVYRTEAAQLQQRARMAFGNYPGAVEEIVRAEGDLRDARTAHANNLILQGIALELAAALCLVAQSIEDHSRR
jgi:hypothetical protein